MHAEICPVCKGEGELINGVIKKQCHGCDGKGWIELSDDGPSYPYIPQPWYPQPWYPYPYWEHTVWSNTCGCKQT